MSTGRGGPRPSRMWWAAPLSLAAVAGAALAAITLPGLANGASVPDRLVVHRTVGATSPPQKPAHTTSAKPTTHPSSPAPVPTAAQAPAASPTTRIVTPDRPVVRERGDQNERSGTPEPSWEPKQSSQPGDTQDH